MTPLVLWFNLLAFAVLFVGFGFELLGWVRGRERWRALYAWYIAIYSGWILVQTFAWFAVSYLPQPPAWLSPAVNFLWVAASVGMMVVVPHYVVIVGGFALPRPAAPLLYLPAAALLAALVLVLRHPAPAQ